MSKYNALPTECPASPKVKYPRSSIKRNALPYYIDEQQDLRYNLDSNSTPTSIEPDG